MAQGKVLNIGGAGGDSLNVYAQLAEPSKKDGIWIKTEEVAAYIQLTNIPYQFYKGSAAGVGNDIYLFGGSYSDATRKYAYKYSKTSNTYTRLTNIPESFDTGSAVAIGTNIYLFCGFGSPRSAYKYDTLTNTYIQLTNIPYQFYRWKCNCSRNRCIFVWY